MMACQDELRQRYKKETALKTAEIAAQIVRASVDPSNTSYESVIATFRKAYDQVSSLVEENT